MSKSEIEKIMQSASVPEEPKDFEEGEGCEECGSLNIETRPSGLIVCNDCHHIDRRGLN